MATVTPGKIFASNEIVTPANLNLLGTPAVVVADNEVTTAKIAADAVTTAKLAANAVTTAKLAANSVTAAKLGANEQLQICKAWVNFTGLFNFTNVSGNSGTSFVTTNGSANAVWNNISTSSEIVGVIIYLPTINGVAGATLGGVNVATEGFQITGVNSASQYAIKLLAGPATSSQTVNGNGTASGYTRSTSGIRASYNVSSITKNTTGTYTVNFATPMADANYTGVATHSGATNVSFASAASVLFSQTSAQLICTSVSGASIGATFDPPQVFLQIFGN